jgi:hypothetical protein
MSLRDRLNQLKSTLSGTQNVAESSNFLKENDVRPALRLSLLKSYLDHHSLFILSILSYIESFSFGPSS